MSWGEEGRRGAGAVRWSVWFAAFASMVAALSMLGSSSDVRANTCPIELVVPCSGSPTPPAPTSTTSVAPTTRVPPTTTTTPNAARQPTAAEAAARLLVLLNVERDRAGLTRFTARGDVAEIASAWSAAMARAGQLSHNDAYFTEGTRRRLRARLLGENVARNADVDAAHRALMASPGHRANILNGRFTVVGLGAQLREGSWWLTEDFLQPEDGLSGADRSRSGAPDAQPPARFVTDRPAVPNVVGHDAGEVLAAGGPTTAPGESAQSSAHRPAALASESLVEPGTAAALLVPGMLGLALTVALRRATGRARSRAIERRDDVSAVAEPGDALDDLTQIGAWARTLDERWAALSECDKRIATQIIRRKAEDALAARRATSTA